MPTACWKAAVGVVGGWAGVKRGWGLGLRWAESLDPDSSGGAIVHRESAD